MPSAHVPRVLVACGRGRYEDPWHDHAAVSHALASLLARRGLDVVVRSLFPHSLYDLAEFDLLVVNGGTGRADPAFDGDDDAWRPAHAAIDRYAFRGGPLLVYHQGINCFLDSPRWHEIVGGRWVRGVTYHPEAGEATFRVVTDSHPLVDGLDDICTSDERYTRLAPERGVVVTTVQHEAGADHPTSWVNEVGGVRTVYDSLGHDAASLAEPGRRALLCREVGWLLRRDIAT